MPETLRELVSRGPVDPSTALSILEQLLKALALDHWRGIIHGDITPENIVLTSTDLPTLAHGGVAHSGDDSAPTQSDTATSNPRYAAPEQIRGGPADERTDIFALGVVAYELLAGKHPFGASDGLTAGSVMYRILHESPLEIPETILAGLPRRIPPVLDVALAKDPADRFADTTSFLDALKGATAAERPAVPERHSPPGRVSPRIHRSKRKRLTGAVVGGLVVVAVVVWLLVALGGDSGTGSSTTVTSGSTTSTGQSALPVVTTTTTTNVAPATIATISTTAITPETTNALTRSEQTDSRLVYAGAWNDTTDGSASESSFSFANSGGASVTIAFEGTYLAWIAKKSPAYGKAEVALDGKSLGTIDLYSATTGWQQKVWGTGTLKSGLHTVTIAWTGTKNAAATDTNICVDAFDVVGSLTQAP